MSDLFILTAAHCNKHDALIAGTEIVLVNHMGFIKEGTAVKQRVKNLFLHPAWTPQEKSIFEGSVDLALVEFEDLSFFESARISTRPLKKSETVIVGGFGCKGRNYPRHPSLTVAAKKILDFTAYLFTVGLKDDALLPNLSFGCTGDSGGGAYRLNPDIQEFEVIGVNSAVTHDVSSFTVSEETGLIESGPDGEEVKLFIGRLTMEEDQDAAGILTWLKAHLPPESFSK